MKYYIISGEASGDLHGSNLILALRSQDPNADFRAWGGEKIQKAGAHIVKNYKDLAFMGFIQVAQNIRTILGNFRFCKADIKSFNPDVLVLIDYPGFNLRMAEWAHNNHYKVVYYIAPQVWAWNRSRVKKIKKYIDLLLVILPFEKTFFNTYGVEAVYVGHPLLDEIRHFKMQDGTSSDHHFKIPGDGTEILALLPGSRKQEIEAILPVMLEAAMKTTYKVIIACAPNFDDTYYESFIPADLREKISLARNQTYNLLKHSKLALVTSGTATLETALLGVPQIVCYKTGRVTYHIAKRLIDLKYISLVNLISNKSVVPELIQDELTVDNILKQLVYLENNYEAILQSYLDLENMLSKNASENAAKEIYSLASFQ